LSHLEYIDIYDNKIKQLDQTLSNGLTSLKEINFRANQTTKIHSSLINGLTNLKSIFIDTQKCHIL